jgi:heterodisulfide reductase subunit C
MNNRVDPNLKAEMKAFGLQEWNDCFHCGNCTALCPLTDDGNLFPRNAIRTMQLGIKDKLMSSVDPWLCYYCGECSDTCPRDANPGEVMMSLRRYLTSLYDWTGLSKKFYTSKVWELGAILLLGGLVVLAFAIFWPSISPELTADGGVRINSIMPLQYVEWADWTMAIIVATLLMSNIFRMYLKMIHGRDKVRVPLWLYVKEAWQLVFHFSTQWKFSKCDGKRYWAWHWLLMTGYTIMFILIVVFLPWFQTEEIHEVWHPQRLLGYYATFGLLVGLSAVIIGRIRKSDAKFKFSHVSDWLFIIMLFLTVTSGILVHFFRIYGLPQATYYTYVAHLAILVPMIMIEVPFSKWSHLAYRPFAIYFASLKKAALNYQKQTQVRLATT